MYDTVFFYQSSLFARKCQQVETNNFMFYDFKLSMNLVPTHEAKRIFWTMVPISIHGTKIPWCCNENPFNLYWFMRISQTPWDQIHGSIVIIYHCLRYSFWNTHLNSNEKYSPYKINHYVSKQSKYVMNEWSCIVPIYSFKNCIPIEDFENGHIFASKKHDKWTCFYEIFMRQKCYLNVLRCWKHLREYTLVVVGFAHYASIFPYRRLNGLWKLAQSNGILSKQ